MDTELVAYLLDRHRFPYFILHLAKKFHIATQFARPGGQYLHGKSSDCKRLIDRHSQSNGIRHCGLATMAVQREISIFLAGR